MSKWGQELTVDGTIAAKRRHRTVLQTAAPINVKGKNAAVSSETCIDLGSARGHAVAGPRVARPYYGSDLYIRNSCKLAATFFVEAWQLHVGIRGIDGSPLFDVAGAYPLTCLDAAADVRAGLSELQAAGFVSFVGVLDPTRNAEAKAAEFPFRRPFKTHFLIRDPRRAFSPTPSHRRHIERAKARCTIDVGPLGQWLSEWEALYSATVQSKGWSELHRFGEAHWRDLAASPEIVAFRATVGGQLAAIYLFVQNDDRVDYHLGVSTSLGYEHRASYLIIEQAVALFSDASVINLGGSAGLSNTQTDGLARFKRGFSNCEDLAWLAGAVLDEAAYASLSRGATTDFFPAYRAPVNHAAGTPDFLATASRRTKTETSQSP